jgi:hypothetical protein
MHLVGIQVNPQPTSLLGFSKVSAWLRVLTFATILELQRVRSAQTPHHHCFQLLSNKPCAHVSPLHAAFVTMSESLEPYLCRKKLFVRVQANVPRELFVQKLNAAFAGARIGVGQDPKGAGSPSQRVADISFENAALAAQALRRNRFKLRVGSHDADITCVGLG